MRKRFGIDLNEALDIVRNHDESYLPPSEIEKRKALVSALDNLVDFATAEETQMYMDRKNKMRMMILRGFSTYTIIYTPTTEKQGYRLCLIHSGVVGEPARGDNLNVYDTRG